MSENKNTTKAVANKHVNGQIDLIDLFLYMINRWYLLIACTVVGAIGMGIATNTEVVPMYRSQSMLFVARAGQIQSWSDLQLGSYMTGDFIVISQSKPVVDTAIQMIYEQDGIELTRSQVKAAVSVAEMEDTHILQFTVTMDDPQIACDLCNAVMDAMADQIAYITSSDTPTIVERAEVNPYAINAGINNNRQVLMGAAGGFAIIAALLCVMYMMDDKIKTAEDVEKYIGATVLVSIPMDKAQTFKKNKKSKKSE
ncbi:MAG: Wzz/FepE/Etk N-terminal domain-containing protein [Saccharofermentans sp.]|nr:Wzz/FepE/Etk N-terminal domain-containing protein [Saccharofermentans sp.]